MFSAANCSLCVFCVLAAARAGIKTVPLPARNRKDLEEIPAAAREKVEFVWLENVDDAIRHSIGDLGARIASRGVSVE